MTARCLVLWATVLAAACGGGEEAADPPEDAGPSTLPASIPAAEVEEGMLLVSPERVREWQIGGAPFVLVDARDSVQYAEEHLPEAINISYVDIRPGAELPPRDARVVVYCSDVDCPISQYAYAALEGMGYREIYDMREGLQGWKAAGYPTVVGGGSTDEAVADTAPPGDTN